MIVVRLCKLIKNHLVLPLKQVSFGGPVVAQWLRNPTRNHETGEEEDGELLNRSRASVFRDEKLLEMDCSTKCVYLYSWTVDLKSGWDGKFYTIWILS